MRRPFLSAATLGAALIAAALVADAAPVTY